MSKKRTGDQGDGDLLEKTIKAQHLIQNAADGVRRAMILLDVEADSDLDRAFMSAMNEIDQVRTRIAPIVVRLREAG